MEGDISTKRDRITKRYMSSFTSSSDASALRLPSRTSACEVEGEEMVREDAVWDARSISPRDFIFCRRDPFARLVVGFWLAFAGGLSGGV